MCQKKVRYTMLESEGVYWRMFVCVRVGVVKGTYVAAYSSEVYNAVYMKP